MFFSCHLKAASYQHFQEIAPVFVVVLFLLIAPVIRISDDDHLPRKCFAHIRHSLLDLESLTFDFERLDVEIFIVLTLSYIYNHDLRSCDYLCILSITRPDAASGRLVNPEPG